MEPSLEDGAMHNGTHTKGSESEEMGMKRIEQIIESVFQKKSYTLIKNHNPIPEEELTFDFTKCEGTLDEAVLALVAVEKVFRLCPDPTATKDDIIHIDKKIDGFLQNYFVQYGVYFKHKDEEKEDADYSYYSHLKEDEQYDDLTILAVRKQ